MKISNLLLENNLNIEGVKKGLNVIRIQKSVTKKLYSSYYGSLVNFKKILGSILNDLKSINTPLSEEDLYMILREICSRVEQVEVQLYSETISKLVGEEETECPTENVTNLEDFLTLYTENLCNKFEKFDRATKRELTELFKLKCDIIDTFDVLAKYKRGVC